MNTISRILLGFIVVAVLATLWVVLTHKNNGTGSCGGNCSACGSDCAQRKREQEK